MSVNSGTPIDAGPKRNMKEWKALIESRLGQHAAGGEGSSPAVRPVEKDEALQTVFAERTKDVAVATVVSTADLARLFPIPDAATLMRSTLPSLRRAEREAAELLKVVQRDLAYQLQEAGVTFDRSSFDDIRAMSVGFDSAGGGGLFKERKQMRFKSSKNPLLAASLTASRGPGPAGGAGYWNFATHHSDLQLYDRGDLRRAGAMDSFAVEARNRHRTFDEGEKQLLQELAATRQLLSQQFDADPFAMPSRYGRGGK